MSNPFGNDFSDLFNGMTNAKPKPTPDPKPLPAIRGKSIDGVLYVRAEDVATALESQAPRPNRKLIDKLRAAAKR